MPHILKNTIVSCALVLMATAAPAQRQWTVTGQEVPELAAVDQMMQDLMQDNDIRGGSVAIAKDGRLVYARGFTWDQPEVEAIQPTTLFRIGSIGKSITSIAIHQLIEQGKLSYSTPVLANLDIQPLGGGQPDPRLDSVTVDHLLTHTSGMFSLDDIYTAQEVVAEAHGVEQPPTKQEIVSYIIAQPFIFEPETNWDYNNYGYIMLGMLAEQAIGPDFPEYVLDNIFRPVGVSRTRMAHTLPNDLAPTETDYDGVYGDPYATMAEIGFAAGLLVMSAPDLARLYSALFDDPESSGLLDNHTVEAMLSTPYAAGEELGYGRGWKNSDFFVNANIDLGWLTDLDDGLQLYGHGGGGSGVHTLALWRSDGITFVFFTNQDPVAESFDFPEITSWPDHDLWESVGISSQPVGSAPAESWIPAVAHADGIGDSIWRSDAGLLNRSPKTNAVRLRFHRGNRQLDRTLELAPGESRTVSDVVDWFERSGSGPLQVFSSEALTTTSRTYNQSSDGTFGQSLDGVNATGGLEAGEAAVLMQLREDDVARSNIGLHNQWRRSARVEVALFDSDGSLVTGHTREIPAQQTVQLNRPFKKFGGRDDVESGYAVVTVLSGQDVYAFASVIDNATGDPTAIPMKRGTGHDRQWIAAAAHGTGAHESVWLTDVCLLNGSGDRASAEITFHRDDGETGRSSFEVAGGQQIVVSDVVGQLGMAGSGAVEIDSDRPLLVSSRTFNTGVDGTFGLFLDGIPDTGTFGEGETAWLAQLRQNAAFRTNIGLVNSSDFNARVRIRFYDATGNELASKWRALGPGAWIQLQEPFSRLVGRDDIDTGYATVEVISGNGVIAYGSVIDNMTNDATAITMKR
jgi:CubicO group peptidase (beta-lactamase class C family)